jgi:hypothetical protein
VRVNEFRLESGVGKIAESANAANTAACSG